MDTENKINHKTLIISVFAIIITEYLLSIVLGYTPLAKYPKTIIIRLVQLVELFAVVILFNQGLPSIGLSKNTAVNGIKKGIIWSLSFGVITGITFIVVFCIGKNPIHFFRSNISGGVTTLLFYLLAGGIVGPVAEEVLFRGILYGFFRKWGIAFGIIATTAIFAVLHLQSGGIPYIQMAGGLIFAISYEIEKSLFVPIIIHVTGNIAIFTLSLI